ncbi:MAG: hypothetical protein Q7R76_03200 [Candidatus Woesearchaeota archaeon]|nr:hypothetical protein [Candidatus Woesearchaeota archaeon]
MAELLTVKVRKIGTSLGVLLPKKQLEAANVNAGDELEIAILPHKKDLSGFGMAKGFMLPFVRDKKDRAFS